MKSCLIIVLRKNTYVRSSEQSHTYDEVSLGIECLAISNKWIMFHKLCKYSTMSLIPCYSFTHLFSKASADKNYWKTLSLAIFPGT
jgi:hypothetical protein